MNAKHGAYLLAGLMAAPAAAQAPAKLPTEQQLLSPEDIALRGKLQPFIHCLNTVANRLPNLAKPYRQLYAAVSKDPKDGADRVFWTMQYKYSGMAFETGDVLGCAKGLDAASAQPPPDEALDALGRAYAEDLRKLDVLAPKVEHYYEQKDYRDDKMAQGRAFNTEYDALLTRLSAGSHEMFVSVTKQNDVMQHRRLDAIERLEGRDLRWQANAFVLQARATLEGLQALAGAKTITKEAVLAQTAPLEARYTEASDYASAHPGESTDAMNLWDHIADYAGKMVAQVKEIRRNVADSPKPAAITNNLESVKYYFDNVINSSNASRK